MCTGRLVNYSLSVFLCQSILFLTIRPSTYPCLAIDPHPIAGIIQKDQPSLLCPHLLPYISCRSIHKGLSALLADKERIDAEEIKGWITGLAVPDTMRDFVLKGTLPPPGQPPAAALLP